MAAEVITRAEVKDFEEWQKGFAAGKAVRDAGGVTGVRVFRDPEERNTVVVSQSFASLDAARAFASNPALAEAMQKSGVLGKPRIEILEVI
jgi:quinol monooxygenase YgiN